LISFVLFQLCWFASVLGAAHGYPLLGPAVVALSSIQVIFRSQPRQELKLAALALLMGMACDAVLMALNAIAFPMREFAPPLWMAGLWANLAFAFSGCLCWLRGKFVLGALFGALGGPLCYAAGARLSALTMDASNVSALIAIAIVWALAMPFLLWIHSRLITEVKTNDGVPSRENSG
jgi:Protein of unknown function (DUF2878)